MFSNPFHEQSGDVAGKAYNSQYRDIETPVQ